MFPLRFHSLYVGMRFIIVVMLYSSAVESLSIEQFSEELTENALLSNYDAVLADVKEPLLELLVQHLQIPKTIYNSSCASFRRDRVLYFSENITDTTKNFTAFVKSHILPIIFLRNSPDPTTVVQHSSSLLRTLKVAKAIHVIYDPLSMNLTLIPYGFLRSDEPRSIARLLTPAASTNLNGYVYKVQYTKLFPFIYHMKFTDKPHRIAGLDQELIETIASYQNATITYQFDPKSSERCPPMDSWVDFNIRRMACLLISADRLYLPQWDAVCVVVPKRHEHLILLQFTKPFQLGVWIFVCIFLIMRFFIRFDRWRLLLLTVVLIEFVLTAGYEVKVIQYMASLRYAPNPRTMADLINRGERFVVGAPEVEMMRTYGAGAKVQVVRAAKDSFIGKMAMLYYCGSAEAFYNSELNYNPRTNDRLAILLPERISPYPTSFGFARGHPLRERFERMLGWVFETGIWRKIYDQYARKEQQFQPLVTPNEYLIESSDFKSLWMVCAVGWGLALAVFVGEKMWDRVQKRKILKVENLMKQSGRERNEKYGFCADDLQINDPGENDRYC
uniref:ionotropic receptor 172 n=1 Tax=Aedes aegypti TaxID=7159 RepID=UPI000C23E6DD|nr:ionotropic receptor 172 [Aedes aegypti]